MSCTIFNINMARKPPKVQARTPVMLVEIMGKSTILTHFSHLLNIKKPSKWAIKVELNDPKLMKNIDQLSDTVNDVTAFKFSENIVHIENDSDRTLLRQRLDGNGEIVKQVVKGWMTQKNVSYYLVRKLGEVDDCLFSC